MDCVELIRELVALPGPPGGEIAVRRAVEARVGSLGYDSRVDAKGNLIVELGDGRPDDSRPSIVVTAHLDEIALIVIGIQADGAVQVAALGGAHPWKWGEQPVEFLARGEIVPGVISFGSTHTNSPASTAQQARTGPLTWEQTGIFTGLSANELAARGVQPGTRIVLARDRRTVLQFGPFLGSYFLDDRADLATWLLALEMLKDSPPAGGRILFAATVSEEVGGEGAAYLLHQLQPDICVALEIGPSVPEGRFVPDEQPTVWARDSYAATSVNDLELIDAVCAELGLRPHWQALSRGGSDATTAATRGLTARPITLGLPVENSHGFEIMHRDAPASLARLLVALLDRVSQ